MYEKLKSGAPLFEHELLEMLLFNAYPRANTNPIAHALLAAFGTINGVLAADIDELVKIDGVGERVALYLKCIGECISHAEHKPEMVAALKNYDDFRAFTAMRMRGKTEETIELYCLEKNGTIKKIYTFSQGDSHKVEVKTRTIANAVAVSKPYGLLVAHNHLTGDPNPSAADDRFTKEVQLICSMNSVRFLDHCIYAAEKVYSYFMSGKIDGIRYKYTLANLVSENKNDE